MFYEAEPEVLVDVGDHPVAAVEEVETRTLDLSNRNQAVNNSDVIIVIDNTQPTSTSSDNLIANTSGSSCATPSSRKRTRKSQLNSTPKKQKLYDEEDDGSTCPICLDIWDNDGGHRLVSLKCGHLFGESCIKRWITENVKCCPTCKKKATKNDIRSIYANRVTSMDTTEIVKYKKLLEKEEIINKKQKEEIDSLRYQLKLEKDLVDKLKKEIDELKSSTVNLSKFVTATKTKTYKLFMEKNLEITKDGGCKVMIHGKRIKSLMISQKNPGMFPGYGIRFVDSTTFRPNNFLPTSSKQIRDITLDVDEEHLLTTSLDKGAKLFNLQQRRVVSVFAPEDKAFWAAAFDCERPKYIYLGAERGGSTYIYDTRNPQSFVHELKMEDDMSPVIKICPIAAREDFPFGGFFVCKLNSVWFYEFDASQQTIGTKLAVDGPFVSMNYEQETQHILMSARPTNNQKKSRYIVAELMKVEGTTNIQIWGTCLGSTVQSVMRRSTLIRIDTKNSIVAAYLEDVKSLCTWSAPSCTNMVSASLTDPVVDLCPIYTNANPYLTALSDNKCRVYKLEITEN